MPITCLFYRRFYGKNYSGFAFKNVHVVVKDKSRAMQFKNATYL